MNTMPDATTRHSRQPAATEIAQAIEDRIVKGIYPPGDRLDESGLAEEFGVSRTPVREAILALVAKEFLEQRTRKGVFVTELSLEDLFEAYEVAAELEGLAARLAARRLGPDERLDLERLHLDMGSALESGDRQRYLDLDERFHQLIVSAARNEVLSKHIAICRARIAPVRRSSIAAIRRIDDAYAEHGALIDAVLSGDSESADRVMHAHVSLRGEQARDLVAEWRARTQ
jgi:DNA-binding GntR family transcriptional regulator